MLVWLLDWFAPLQEQIEVHSTGDSRVYLTARIAAASVTAFLMCILLGPVVIRWLKSRFQEKIKSDSERLNELHANKSSTPTMGGIFIVSSIVVSVLIWGNLSSSLVLLGLFTLVSFALLGAFDDWVKLKSTHNGITVRQKFFIQCALAFIIGLFLYWELENQPLGHELVWPFGNITVWVGFGLIVWSVFIMVGFSNAVNLTDGLDGLACGCMIFSGAGFVVLTYLSGHKILAEYLSIPYLPGTGELSVVMGAMVGAVLGFLWFNCHPAQVFMGDTGALSIGALLSLSALATKQEVLLVIVGGVFVVETLSVIFQVGWFKMTGNRIIACSPLHNHFLFKGQNEMKIVVRFWIVSALLALIAVASLKIR